MKHWGSAQSAAPLFFFGRPARRGGRRGMGGPAGRHNANQMPEKLSFMPKIVKTLTIVPENSRKNSVHFIH